MTKGLNSKRISRLGWRNRQVVCDEDKLKLGQHDNLKVKDT